ncbi:MarR family winged helix-turn-helix transcriptional regulator [Streptomyces sp. VRA16 Mangrove soil]|uniref:MarR family winged helix-turn-helix transcriptional regulator n=1 Tax=Streptomyces sp. VRA16 Mangrove soil TaxID=2817434 RepID=UPI001A9F8A79|nr:MarR family transcriptional regulator [Streptomyces sp. VRA16 Mangrove soil]MBO1336928.1 MarR family transcriptional regulator [Streptomyces sp. VRA16 Mangrove soil]
MSNTAALEGPTPGYLVWRLSMKVRTAMDRALTPLGLTHATYSVLTSLHGLRRAGESPSQRQLADHTGLEPLYVSKLARSLEKAGLITRPRDAADSRALRLALTDEGEAVVERAIPVVRQLMARLFEPLGGPDGERTRALAADLQVLLDVPL